MQAAQRRGGPAAPHLQLVRRARRASRRGGGAQAPARVPPAAGRGRERAALERVQGLRQLGVGVVVAAAGRSAAGPCELCARAPDRARGSACLRGGVRRRRGVDRIVAGAAAAQAGGAAAGAPGLRAGAPGWAQGANGRGISGRAAQRQRRALGRGISMRARVGDQQPEFLLRGTRLVTLWQAPGLSRNSPRACCASDPSTLALPTAKATRVSAHRRGAP